MEVFIYLFLFFMSERLRGFLYVFYKVAVKKSLCLKVDVSGVIEVRVCCFSNDWSIKGWFKRYEMGYKRCLIYFF